MKLLARLSCCAALSLALVAPAQADKLTIAAAADLKFAMAEVVQKFRATRPGDRIEVIYGSSGKFFTQIKNGAPFDMYFSADVAYPRALAQAGLAIGQVDIVKTHNPFAVNDLVFARTTGIDWRVMNPYGCSLVWGHPQAPMGTRAIIELIEALALRGGGRGLFTGCAAGDTAMAVVLEVGDAG